MEYFLGLDLGQQQDYTALVVLAREQAPRVQSPVTYQWEPARPARLAVVKVERVALGTPYTDVARWAAEVTRRCALKSARTLLCVDVTGVGACVVDLLREQDLCGGWLLPVLITGGYQRTYEGDRYHVPKADLVDGAVQAMQKGVLCAADGVRLDQLMEEMQEFGIKLGVRQDRYEGRKDDLVMALCLAIWGAGMAKVP
ncbi:MAG: hypothetical protein ABI693_28225 [Bryobacteraceae bacterium]